MVEYPEALDSDPDDVSTALTVGASFWARGERDDAVKWLRKAADEAFDAGLDDRGLALSKLAASLISVVPPPRPSLAPPVSVAPPPPIAPPVAPPVAAPTVPLVVASSPEPPVAAPVVEPSRQSLPVMVQSETATQEFAVAVAAEVVAQPPRVATPPAPAAAVVAEPHVERTAVSASAQPTPPVSARSAPVTPPKPALPRPSVTSSATASTRPGTRTGRPAGFAVKPGDATRSTAPIASSLRVPTPPPLDETPSVHDRETPVVDVGSAVRTSMGTGTDLDATQADGPRPTFDRALLTPLGGAQRRMTPPRPAEAVAPRAEVVDTTMSARIEDAAVEALVHSAFPDAVPEAMEVAAPKPAANDSSPPVTPEVPAPPRVRARLWNATDALRVAVSRDAGRVVLRAYDGVGLRDGEVEAVIIGLSGGPELSELLGDDAVPSGDV